MSVYVFEDAAHAAAASAERIAELLNERLAVAARATLAVSGGTTPALMFAHLAKLDVEWQRVHFFQVDERMVPADDPQSNARLLAQYLLDPAGVPAENLHRVETEHADAAERYAAELRSFFGLDSGQMPAFDVVHRGMGGEGHTASLFPGEPLIANETELTALVTTPKPPPVRVTLLPGPLAAARHTAMLVAGADKAEAVRDAFALPYDPLRLPVQIGVKDSPAADWYLDHAAARLLPRE